MAWLITWVIKFVSRLVSLTPRRIHLIVGASLGLVWFYIVRVRRQIVFENIHRAFPDKSNDEVYRIARANFINYGQCFIEFLLLPVLDKKLYFKITQTDGWENYKKEFDKGQGVFLLSLHLGSWEYMSAGGVHLGIPLHIITKKMKVKWLNDVWINLRLDRGLKLIREEKTTFEILRAIRNGHTVGFILDQFMGPPVGVRTVFFGHETGTAASLALFADRTRAPVVPVYCVRDSDGTLHTVFDKPVEFLEQGSTEKNISFMTQAYTSRIEEIVKKYPELWLWLHRRWKPFRE